VNGTAVVDDDSQRIHAIATRLALTPDAALVLAARLARRGGGPDPAWLAAELARLRAAPQALAGVAALLALNPFAFALDEVDTALATLTRAAAPEPP